MEKGEFPPPRKIRWWVDEALEAVCLKAMSFRAEDRYGGARELADDIQRWLADEPVTAWREPITRRVGRWARRHRTLVTSSTVAAVLAAAVWLYLFNQAQVRLKTANGRLEALLTAEVRSIPAIREQLAPIFPSSASGWFGLPRTRAQKIAIAWRPAWRYCQRICRMRAS